MSIWRPERGWATVGARVVAVTGGVAVLGYGLLLGGSSDAAPAEGDHPRMSAVQEPEPRRSRLCRLALKAQWDIDHHGTRSTSGTADAESGRRIEKADGREDGAIPDPAMRNTRDGGGGAPGADDPRGGEDRGGGHVVGGGRADHPARGGSDEGDRRDDTSGTGDTSDTGDDSDARGGDGRDEQSRRDDRERGDRREDHGADRRTDHRADDWADDWQDRRDDAEDAREDAREDAAEGEAWQAFAVSFEDAEEDPRAGHGED